MASGTITLSGVLQLNALSGFDPAPGTEITLIQNAGTSPIAGQFQGLPEGSVITVNNIAYTLSYQSGSDGQDVVLTAGSGPPGGVPVANCVTAQMGQGETASINCWRTLTTAMGTL